LPFGTLATENSHRGAPNPFWLSYSHRRPSIALLVGGEIEGAGIDKRPVSMKLNRPFMRIAVVVEKIGHGNLAEGEGHSRDIGLFADLIGPVRNILLLAAKSKIWRRNKRAVL